MYSSKVKQALRKFTIRGSEMIRIKSSVVSMAAYVALLVFIFAGGAGAANCPPDDEVNLRWTLKPAYVRSGDTVYFEVTTDDDDGGTYTWLCSRSNLGTFTPNGNSAMFETLPDRVREIFTIYCTYSFEDSDQENICSYTIERSYALCGADMLVDSNYDRYRNLSDNATEVSQGGIVVLNNDDDNTNGVPDYNDTFWDQDLYAVNMPFIPYGAGGVVTLTQTLGQDKVKVYRDVTKRNGYNMSQPQTWTWPAQIFPSLLYIEGIQRSSSRGDIEFVVTWTKESYSESDTIRLTVFEADLDVDSNHYGGIDDTDDATEVSAGGIVPLGGVAPINITLRPVKPSGGGTLTLDAPLGKTNIKVWMNPDKTSLVTLPASWALDSAPPTLYVEGCAASSSMRDVELSLQYNSPYVQMNQKDTIKLTVVDVDLAVDSNNDGYIWSDDNEIEDNSGTLGLLICKNDDHDNGYQDLPDCDNEVLENYPDTLDCGIMELSLMPSGLPNGSVVELSVNDSSKVRIFRYAADPYQPKPYYTCNWDAIIGPSSGSSWTRTLSAAPYPSLEYFLIEGVNPGLVEITVIYKIPNGSGEFIEVARDMVKVTIYKVLEMREVVNATAIADGSSAPRNTDFFASLKGSGDSVIKVVLEPNIAESDFPDSLISWTGGSAVPGHKLQRKVSRGASDKYTLVFNSSYAGVIYIIWCEGTGYAPSGAGDTWATGKYFADNGTPNRVGTGPEPVNVFTGKVYNRNEIQFTVNPSDMISDGVDGLFDTSEIKFDTKRDKRTKYWQKVGGVWLNDSINSYPDVWRSDDNQHLDEDNDPWNANKLGHLYGNDTPSITPSSIQQGRIQKLNMYEWVRCVLGGGAAEIENFTKDNAVADKTLASDPYYWHSFQGTVLNGTIWERTGPTVSENEIAVDTDYWGVEPVSGVEITSQSPLLKGVKGLSGYSMSLTASGGTAPYTWSLDGGSLPSGLALATDGTISGTPSATGTFSFAVEAEDSAAAPGKDADVESFEIFIADALVVTTASLVNGTADVAYNATLASNGGNLPITWTLDSGVLTPGLTLAAAGVISGTPTTNGVFNLTVKATDSSTAHGAVPATATKELTLTVN